MAPSPTHASPGPRHSQQRSGQPTPAGGSVPPVPAARAGHPVKPGHLPVTELLSDRPGASSPFGDDQTFPLPASALVYRHPKNAG